MSVTIRPMTGDEFERFCQWSIEQQAAELMKEQDLPRETARKETAEEVAGMLPDGLHTAHNHFLTIMAADENVGFLWTIHEETEGRKQCFLCDFAIWESKRRNGYGAAALHLAEQEAAKAGCLESVLFVSEKNAAARALYEKCGYRVLRRAGRGSYLIKQLPDLCGCANP